MDESRRRRHHVALLDELEHHRLRRRALRPARGHHRRRRSSFTSPTVTNVLVDNAAPTVSLALANGPTGAYLSAGKVYFKANAAGKLQLRRDRDRHGFGAGVGDVPDLERGGVDDTHSPRPTPRRRVAPTRRATSRGRRCERAGGVHDHRSRRFGQHRHVGGHLHARLDGADRLGDRAGGGGERPWFGGGDLELGRRRCGSGSAQFQTSPAGAGTWSNLGAADTASPRTP